MFFVIQAGVERHSELGSQRRSDLRGYAMFDTSRRMRRRGICRPISGLLERLPGEAHATSFGLLNFFKI